MKQAALHPGSRSATGVLRAHWPEYAMEALELGLFMVSASTCAVLLFHPASPASQAVESGLAKRALMGIAMGLTAIALIYSPMGQRSGAHMNPSVTLTFWRLGKIANWDAAFYILAQFSGAILGMLVMSALLGEYLDHSAVRFVATTPGALGVTAAWLGEFVIALVMMLTVLTLSNRKTVARYTGLAAGFLVAAFIFIESPISGTSMNPARTFGSSLSAQLWTGLWIYFTAPPLAMLVASELYLRTRRGAEIYCAKLNHFNDKRCIFRCGFHTMIDDAPAHARTSLVEPKSAVPVSAAAAVPQDTLHFG